ncbi:deoxyribose-phosphate aldolase [Pseudoalteromonas ruthenica]|uniref:deoxyribose-phosphate aldolase n=1 Tax=Pseudoalteromonas ruthenica TaxID=151081 RepID=UPI00241FEC7A|nr:deoxyribose-phosphate aldolase [Pseudoalteromonas ruthenica]
MSDVHDAQLALACLDYTRLQEHDSEDAMCQFVAQINTAYALPAALCVYPQWLQLTRRELDNRNLQQIPLATVTNFPTGDEDLTTVLAQTREALQLGTNEIDLVLPYRALQQGDEQKALEYVRQSRELCANKAKLKVIIESGELSLSQVRIASRIAIAGGADFIKTSTGKVAINATPEAVAVIFDEVAHSERAVGVKVSGGVKNLSQAQLYLDMAVNTMGGAWLTPFNFRFGASSLLGELYNVL